MRFYSLLAFLFLCIVSGCDKEDPAPEKTAEEIVKEEITGKLAAESDLSTFSSVFNELELEEEDIANGITVFAPANNTGNPGGRMEESAPGTTGLTPEILKGHIVKGLVNAADLEDGETLTSLNGKKLLVTVSGNEIKINDVLLTAKDLASGEKFVIHKVKEILEHPVASGEQASIVVTVWNSLKWSPEKPKGAPEVGVTIAFYENREHYADGNPVYTASTNNEGKATFPDAKAGKSYFILAKKDGMSNVFYRSTQPVNGTYQGYVPDGLFQSQAEVAAHAVQAGGAPGNFRWRDLNADGIINASDRVPVPHLEAKPVFSQTEVEVIIGYDNNDRMVVRNGEDALQTLQECRNLLNTFHKTIVMMDGVLSDDAECTAGDANSCALDNFTFGAHHPTFLKLWNDAYNALGQLNLLLRDVPGLTVEGKEPMLAEVKGLRAYLYLELVTYFGDVPIMEGITLSEDAMRQPKIEVFAQVESDLQAAVDALPAGPSGNRYKLTLDAAKLLLARVALLKKDWPAVASRASAVLESGRYLLMNSNDAVFMNATNEEIIWDFSFTLPPGFAQYFYGRTFCPALRLAEAYLIKAEASIEINDLGTARANLDIIRVRLGMQPSTAVMPQELRQDLRDTWKAEMKREGKRFANLVRWQAAPEVLGPKGFNQWHSLLPIPLGFIDKHFNMTQNPGY
jgi:starch-binding outer membrane protein, SusD/RagB family